jgi:hypothetical protein
MLGVDDVSSAGRHATRKHAAMAGWAEIELSIIWRVSYSRQLSCSTSPYHLVVAAEGMAISSAVATRAKNTVLGFWTFAVDKE